MQPGLEGQEAANYRYKECVAILTVPHITDVFKIKFSHSSC